MNKIASSTLFFMCLIFSSSIVNGMGDDTCHFDSNLVALCTSFKEIIPQICLETYSFCPTYARMARTCTTMHQILGRKEELLPYIAEYALNDQRIVNNMNENQLAHMCQYVKNNINNNGIKQKFVELRLVRNMLLNRHCSDDEDEYLRSIQDTYINVYRPEILKHEILWNRHKIVRFIANHLVGISYMNLNASINECSIFEWTINCQNTEMIRLLLDQGADVNVKNVYGEGTLIFAVSNWSSVKVLGLLLNYGADINSVNQKGQTALFIAVAMGNSEAAFFLLQWGADANIESNSGDIPYSVAKGNESFFGLLASRTSFYNKYKLAICLFSYASVASVGLGIVFGSQ